jgi:hypothetical protein
MTEQDRLEFLTKTLSLPDFQVVHQRRDTPADPFASDGRPPDAPRTVFRLLSGHGRHPPYLRLPAGQGSARGAAGGRIDRPYLPIPLPALRPLLHPALPRAGGGRSRYRAFSGAGGQTDPLQRHRQRRCLPGRGREEPGALVLRLRPTPGSEAAGRRQADQESGHR